MEPTSKIIPLSIDQTFTAPGIHIATTKFNSMCFAQKSHLITTTYAININFLIDSNNYHINLINYAGAFPTANVVAATTTTVVAKPPTIVRMSSQDSQAGTANCIGVGVIDIWLYLYCE